MIVIVLLNKECNSSINLSSDITLCDEANTNSKDQIIINQTSYNTYTSSQVAANLKSSGGTIGGGSENLSIKNNVIRKLTPLECERLQGFPDYWTTLTKKDNMPDNEYDFWLKTYQNHKLLREKSFNQNMSKEKLLKWYNKLECDSSRYKALGNSIAIPCVSFIMKRIKEIGFNCNYDYEQHD